MKITFTYSLAPARTGSAYGGCFVTTERTRTRRVSQRCIKHPMLYKLKLFWTRTKPAVPKA